MRSNLAFWQELQEGDYFEHHRCYGGLVDLDDDTAAAIAPLVTLRPDMKVVVIGCGYGRETAHLAPLVDHVFGIDVSLRILDKAVAYLGARGVSNFTPVLAEEYRERIPPGIDLVFSVVVMQHLTRDLVRDYCATLGARLAPDGVMLLQFMERPQGEPADADLRAYEPAVSWTLPQIAALARDAGLHLIEARSSLVMPDAFWHFALVGRHKREIFAPLCGALAK
jgi:cyclopropane fatty-acyl-phospholipid synthase-like methyltransferase